MIYVDTCVLIYALETDGPAGERAREALLEAPAALVISPLVIHEALVIPLRHSDARLLGRIDSALRAFEVVDISPDDYIRASALRARRPALKLADALHLAVAQGAGCTELWTNDSRLTTVAPGFAIDVLGRERRTGNG